MAFDTQITDLVGGTIDQTACDQWAADACKEIINVLPAKLKSKCSTFTQLNNSATTMDLDSVGEILQVTRLSANSGGFQVPCREIPAIYGGLAEDSTSLDYYGTASDPVFWTLSNTSDVGTLFVKPDPEATQVANVYHITYPTVDVSAVSTIANFPDEAEHLVVLYVAAKQLHQYMNSKSSDLPSDITVPVLENVSETLPTWSAPSDFVAPTVPVIPTISAVAYTDATNADASVTAVATATATAPSIIDVSGNAPTYTKPTITTRVAFSSYTSGLTETDPGVFSINSVAPSTPSISTIAYTDATNADASNSDAANSDASVTGVDTVNAFAPTKIDVSSNAPTYTPPVIAGATEELTVTMTAGAQGTDADQIDYGDWFEVLGDMIEDNEDLEMASAQLQKISTYLNSYQLAMQNQLNEFNEANVRYQMEFQEEVTKANQDLQVAIANANTLAAEKRQEAQQATEMSKFNKQQDQTLDQFNKQQDQALDQFNKSQDQALNLANAAKAMEKLIQDNSSKLQKYQSELSVYSANVSKEVQEYGQNLSRYSTELNTAYTAWAKTESDSLQQYSTDIQNELNEYNKDNVRYQMEFQEAVTKSNADLQVAIANANALASEYQQEAQQATEMDKFNKSQDQALNIANEAKAMERLVADNSSKLQKYQAEVGTYSAELNTNVQTFTNAVTKNRAAFDTSMQKYTSEIQKVSSSNATILQKFSAETSNFSAQMQKEGMDYQWYQSQYAQLKADYNQGLQQLISGGISAQGQQGA